MKVKSPEQEQPASRQQKLKHKDLAAILEEKKQGGPAIGMLKTFLYRYISLVTFSELCVLNWKIMNFPHLGH